MRFEFGENEEQKEEQKYFFEDEFDEFDENDIIEMAQVNLVSYDINQKILQSAIKVAENSLFWRFKSPRKKLELIKNIYQGFSKLIEEE